MRNLPFPLYGGKGRGDGGSNMVELIWDGKYDKKGKRAAPLRVDLPFQTVETVNESAQQRQRSLDLFSQGKPSEWRNRLIWGDKKYVLPSLLPEFAGKVDLIYIDPPFATGQDFSFQARVGDETFEKEASIIEQKAYRDTWGSGLDGYLKWFYETATYLHELLSEKGSLYVHLDCHVSNHVKVILDEVFGMANFKNQITWKRTGSHGSGTKWGPITDTLHFFTKHSAYTWNRTFQEYEDEYIEKFYRNVDERGRFSLVSLTGAGTTRGESGQPWRGVDPTESGRHWAVPRQALEAAYPNVELSNFTVQERLDMLDKVGLVYWPKTGSVPRQKRYLDEGEGVPIQELVTDITPIGSHALERLGYATQKPEALLERIIRASSNEGDLVLDCFCGSGTTPAVAEKLNRRWIACDLGRFAIHTSRKRLLAIENVRPFAVQNLGKYERQHWQKAEFGAELQALTQSYRKFILDLYHADMVTGYTWLHGVKGGRMVHVGAVDSPIAIGDVRQIAMEFRRAVGAGDQAPARSGVDVLGWDFALDMNETARQIADEAGINLRFVRIPREVLEQKAVDQGDIQFFELAALSLESSVVGRELTLELTDFIVPPDDVPADVMRAVKHWSEWIDYWAVDFDFRDDAFHNQWQSYRTRADRSLLLRANHRYDAPGDYTVMVKVIDILGNDTTKTLGVSVR